MPTRRLSQEKKDSIVKLSAEGNNFNQIGKILGLSRVTVMRYLTPSNKRYNAMHNPPKTAQTPEQRKQSKRNRYRNGIITTTINGVHGHYHIKKRPYTGYCELCKKVISHLAYHHWDDEHPELGMWLCIPCHQFCEGLEHGLQASRYLELKDKVIKDVGQCWS
jgi:IS30 family transposase